MTDEPIPERELEEQGGEELTDPASLGDPEDLPAGGKLPAGAPKEPGLPPPRD